MKIPNKITICNNTWDIVYQKDISDSGQEVCGLCFKAEKKIVLSSDLKGQDLSKTFFHELFHAVIFEYSLNQAALSEDLEEIINDVFANYLVDNFYLTPKPKILEK